MRQYDPYPYFLPLILLLNGPTVVYPGQKDVLQRAGCPLTTTRPTPAVHRLLFRHFHQFHRYHPHPMKPCRLLERRMILHGQAEVEIFTRELHSQHYLHSTSKICRTNISRTTASYLSSANGIRARVGLVCDVSTIHDPHPVIEQYRRRLIGPRISSLRPFPRLSLQFRQTFQGLAIYTMKLAVRQLPREGPRPAGRANGRYYPMWIRTFHHFPAHFPSQEYFMSSHSHLPFHRLHQPPTAIAKAGNHGMMEPASVVAGSSTRHQNGIITCRLCPCGQERIDSVSSGKKSELGSEMWTTHGHHNTSRVRTFYHGTSASARHCVCPHSPG